MTDTTILEPIDEPTLLEQFIADEQLVLRLLGIAADLRFFLVCYLAGLFVFLVMLS